jgi:Chaperone of endosialidase
MASRTTAVIDIIQTKLIYVRNFTDNSPISSKNILYADGSGGTYWSSIYIENIPGFSSYYNSTIGLASTNAYQTSYGLSSYYGSTLTAYGNSLSSFSTVFNCGYIPGGVYSTIAGLGSLGYVSAQTLTYSVQSSLAGIAPLLISTVSSVQSKRLAYNIAPDAFELLSSGRRVAAFNLQGSLALGQIQQASTGVVLDVFGQSIFRSNTYVYPGGLAIGKPVACNVNAELDVSGNILTNNIFASGQGIFNGSVTAAQYLTSSDSNLKTNVTTYLAGGNAWSSLRGVRFNWLSNGKEDIGFIAQELQEVIPEAVSVNEEGRLYIDPTKVIPLLVETVKDLKAKYASLEMRVSKLEN